MEPLLFAAGIFLVLVATLDALWTTLWGDGGAAPMSRGVMRVVRAAFDAIGGRSRPRLRSVGAPVMLVVTLSTWVVLLWLGWSLVFLSDSQALVHASSGAMATTMDRVYFAGYSVFTLGNGGFTPQGPLWQMMTVLASGTGLGIVTLGITYLISVLSAQVDQRAAASLVLTTADDPVSLVLAWRDKGQWPEVHAWMRDLTSRIGRTTEQHMTYPVLHFLAGGSRSKSPAVAVAVLDEAITILKYGIAERHGVSGFSLEAMSSTLLAYAETMEQASHLRLGTVPAPPDLSRLSAAGVQTVGQAEFEHRLQDLAQRRRRWLALVVSNGWSWPE